MNYNNCKLGVWLNPKAVAVLLCVILMGGCKSTEQNSQVTVGANSMPGVKEITQFEIGTVGAVVTPVPSGVGHPVGVGFNFLTGEPGQFALRGSQPITLVKVDEMQSHPIAQEERD